MNRRRERNADHVALEVLCRVFEDGADKAMDEWRDFYDPREWLHFSRALGAFIYRRQHPGEYPNLRDGLVPAKAFPRAPKKRSAK